jgi:UDP-glucose 4-epimerase
MDKKPHSFARVLVAGGAGFIGSHLVDRLLEEEIEVIVLDNLCSGKYENVEQHKSNRKFHFIEGDVRNYDLLKRTVKDVDAVFNEAALVSVSRSMENPILVNEVNVGGTLNLLKACLDSNVKRFIQASSASVYGNTERLPISESQTPNPISPYAVAELAAENYVKVFHLGYGLETVCVRYFNVYGPRQAFNVYSSAITIFLNELLQDKNPVIFGDGNQTRDFVYVEDVVNANMLALNAKKAIGEIFNIATGTPYTINEVVRNLQEKLGKQHLKPIHKPIRKGEIKHSYANIEKAERILGYKPEFSLQKGITRLVESCLKT